MSRQKYNLYSNARTFIAQLMKKPIRDSKLNTPLTDPITQEGMVHQADLLFLPEDNSNRAPGARRRRGRGIEEADGRDDDEELTEGEEGGEEEQTQEELGRGKRTKKANPRFAREPVQNQTKQRKQTAVRQNNAPPQPPAIAQDGYKYALVVVDIGSRICDAEPLKTKDAIDVREAFKAIYARGPLKLPKAIIQVDNGTEFKSAVAMYFQQQNVMLRKSKPYRHRQQAVVERYNGIIARALFYNQHQIEDRTGQPSTVWVNELPEVIQIMNRHIRRKNRAKARLPEPFQEPKCDPNSRRKECELLNVNDQVRVILEVPRGYDGKVESDKRFRETDLRWTKKIEKVINVSIQPFQPPLYSVTGPENKFVLFTRNQLQKV